MYKFHRLKKFFYSWEAPKTISDKIRRIFIVLPLINVWNILKKSFWIMYDSSLLNWRQRNLAFNSGKAFLMQAFGKSFPLSSPFSVNGEQKRQNSDESPALGRAVGMSWSLSCLPAQTAQGWDEATPRHTFLSQVAKSPPSTREMLRLLLLLAAELPGTQQKGAAESRLEEQGCTSPLLQSSCSLPWQTRLGQIRAFPAWLCSRSGEFCYHICATKQTCIYNFL